MSALWLSEYLLGYCALFLGTVLFGIYAYFKYAYTYWARRGVPYLPPTFPLGNNLIIGPEALSYGLETYEWYNAFKKMGVKCGGVWNFCNKALVLVDTELIKDIMTKDFNLFINREFYHNPEDDPRSNNLFVKEDEEWRYIRQKMTPAFTSSRMKFMFESVLKCSDILISLFDKAVASKEDVSLRLLLDKYTMDNIGVVAFGLNFNCQLSEDTKFREMADMGKFPKAMMKLSRVAGRICPKFAQKLGFRLFDKEITQFFGSIVLENVEQRRKQNTRRNDFTQLLIDIYEASQKDDIQFTMDDLIANCIIFFFAGFDTSSKTMQYTLLELARNQDIQEKARTEIRRVLNNYNGELTYEGLQEMTYVRQIVDETLRLYPPVLTLSRVAQKNYKLKGTDTVIEKGTTVLISTVGLQRDPDLFPDPEKYDPERFSHSNKGNIVSYSYLPFGEGPRNCIGRRFGLMQASMGLVRILRNYKIDLSPKVKFPINIQHGQFLLETQEVYVKANKIN